MEGWAGQKGTTIIIISRKQTWPMVTTAGSRERVRFVFMGRCCCCLSYVLRMLGSPYGRSAPIEHSVVADEQVVVPAARDS